MFLFLVLEDVSIFVFLSSLVMILVSFPVYVKVAHFCLLFGVFCSMLFGLCCLWSLYAGELLLSSTTLMCCNWWFLSECVIGQVFIRFMRKLTSVFLWAIRVIVHDQICRSM
jgi:hypothetical protein